VRLGFRSHFEYQTQALLYVPQQMPDPRYASVRDIRCLGSDIRLFTHTRGRAFRAVYPLPQMLSPCTIGSSNDYPR